MKTNNFNRKSLIENTLLICFNSKKIFFCHCFKFNFYFNFENKFEILNVLRQNEYFKVALSSHDDFMIQYTE
jgi:hypothetical protein